MSIEKHITFSMLRSKRDQLRGFAEAEKFLRDRADVYLLDLDSFQELIRENRICYKYDCLEVKANPDFDW